MEHPGVSVTQIKEELNLEEIQTKLSELNKRLSFAYRSGNQPLVNQLTMVLECYQRAQREILDEMFGQEGEDQQGKIDISS
jgi:hypothetical protein